MFATELYIRNNQKANGIVRLFDEGTVINQAYLQFILQSYVIPAAIYWLLAFASLGETWNTQIVLTAELFLTLLLPW